MDQYVVSGLVMNRENLTNPVPVEPRAGAALTTTNAPATHCENGGGVCVCVRAWGMLGTFGRRKARAYLSRLSIAYCASSGVKPLPYSLVSWS